MFRTGLFSGVFGDVNYNQQTIAGQSFQGNVHLNQSKITSDASFLGSLVATASELQGVRMTGQFSAVDNTHVHGTVAVTGDIDANGAKFSQNVEVIGSIHARRSNFAGDVNVVSREITLTDTSLARSISFNDDGKGEQPRLVLKNTTINGDVHFRGSNGIIVKDEATKIVGRVIGARVVNNTSSAVSVASGGTGGTASADTESGSRFDAKL